MRKTIAKWLALALGAALTLSGCSMVTVDKATEDAQVVAEFTGGQITRGEAMEEYESWASMYEAYGYPLSDEADIKQVKQEVLDSLVQQGIIKIKAQEMGLTELSDDDKAELSEQAAAEYEDAISYYMTYFEGDTEEETRQNAIDYLNSAGYTLESIEQYNIENAWQDKLKTEITKDVSVTDEQVQAAYDEAVAADQESFTEDSYNFESAVTYGSTVSWIPEGYRAVKHILLELTDEDSSALSDLTYELEDVNVRIEELENPDTAADEEGDDSAFADAASASEAVEDAEANEAETEATAAPENTADETVTAEPASTDAADETVSSDEKSDAEEASATQDETVSEETSSEEATIDSMALPELQVKKADLEQQITAMKAAILAKFQPTIDEIQGKIAAGEDFDALIEAYGKDEGMTTEPTKTNGYYVSENSQIWDDDFTRASMALEKIGDVSDPILSQSGIHIIKYIGDVTPGAVPLETIRADIEEQALQQATDDLYDATVSQWVSEANVKTYIDRLS